MTMPAGELEAVVASADSGDADANTATVEGRSLFQIAWRRIRSSKVAMISLGVLVFLLLIAIFAPVLTAIEGQDPTTFHNTRDVIDSGSVSFEPGLPLPGFKLPSSTHWLGVEPQTGRDIFARIVYGARVSLTIAFLATLMSVVIGTTLGAMAAYFGGVVDTVISRFMDLLLAFPQLLFLLTLTPILQARLGHTFLGKGSTLPIASLIFILGFFGWPYLARIVRGQVLSLREREFVEAARAMGASPRRIIFKEIIPNVAAVVLVYATLTIPANITAEAALSFLGVGVRDPTPSWGQMLNQSQSNNFYQLDPWFMLVPGLALLITVLSFNLLGDAVRDALDPRAGRS
ncbi:MAG: peptide ABC transporter permease [Pseudonocardiales bacterium]|nr:MAG: peptide ABC transporter permease [Pseudonocardiales bacterium]